MIGLSVAEAFDRLVHFERAAETCICALQTGRPLRMLSEAVAEKMAREWGIMTRSGTRGRPALDLRSTARTAWPKRSRSGMAATGVRLAQEQVRHRCLDLLPRHASVLHNQRVAQIDHVDWAGAKEIFGGSSVAASVNIKSPPKLAAFGIQTGGFEPPWSPRNSSIHAGCGGSSAMTITCRLETW